MGKSSWLVPYYARHGLLLLLEVDTTTVAWIFLQLVGGIGSGILFPAMALAIQASVTAKDQAYAANMFSFLPCLWSDSRCCCRRCDLPESDE